MSLTSTSVPPLVTSDTCPYFPSSVPYYLVTVVQPYSENLAMFSFNYLNKLIKGECQELKGINISVSIHAVSTNIGLYPRDIAMSTASFSIVIFLFSQDSWSNHTSAIVRTLGHEGVDKIVTSNQILITCIAPVVTAFNVDFTRYFEFHTIFHNVFNLILILFACNRKV